MNRLLDIGFKYVGNWKLENDSIDFRLNNHSTSVNVLYSFISNGEIKYIGKTTQQLQKRLYAYKNPGKTQSTNIKNNKNIKKLLNTGDPVDIFILPDNGLLNYGGFSLNLAAGLEDSLIATIDPEWNGGKKEQNSDTLKNDVQKEPDPKTANTSQKFSLKLGKAYYRQGFINIPISHSEQIAENGKEIEFFICEDQNPVFGYINRTANTNGTPRLMGGKKLKEKIINNFGQNETVEVEILSCQSIVIKKLHQQKES